MKQQYQNLINSIPNQMRKLAFRWLPYLIRFIKENYPIEIQKINERRKKAQTKV